MARPNGIGLQLGCALAIVVAVSPIAASAGAWTLDAGTGDVSVAGSGSSSNRIFDSGRNLQPVPRYSKFEFAGLIEYGATNWLTLMLLPQLQHIEIASPIDARRTGLGYTEFGGRAKLFDSNAWVFSVQTTLRVPA